MKFATLCFLTTLTPYSTPMAPKKKKKKAPRQKKALKKKAPRRSARPLFFTIFFFLLIAITLSGTLYFIFLQPGTQPPPLAITSKKQYIPPPRQLNSAVLPAIAKSKKQLYEEPTSPLAQRPTLTKPHQQQKSTPKQRPQVAIIIDDMGHQEIIGQRLIALAIPLSFSFLPGAPHTNQLMQQAHQRGREILLHLPMEPSSQKWDPGPGALFTSMADPTIIDQVEADLKAVPLARGGNNHMGSKFTQNRAKMRVALLPFKKRGLFFIDSVTIATSVAAEVATELHIKTARRDIFLDNNQDMAKIKKQLDLLIKQANKHGSAIAIGHPHSATLQALERYQYWLQRQVDIVPAHKLTR